MSDIHRRVIKLYMMEEEGRPLSPAQRSEMQSHLSSCPSCQVDLQVFQELHVQADQHQPAVTSPNAQEEDLQGTHPRGRLHWVTLPLRVIIWIGLALLAFVLVQWIFTDLRPTMAVLPTISPTPDRSTPAPLDTPAAFVDEAVEIPLEPLLKSESAGQGLWSPEGDYFFIPLMDIPAPGGDRRLISLHFISTATGDDCPASETFLGQGGFQNYAWLDNERVLFIDNNGRAFLFTACMAGSQDLSDRFDEPLVRVALPLAPPQPPVQGLLLLEASSAYWLLDPVTLQARELADPVPSPELADSFAWLTSENQVAVLQPVAGKPELSRLVLLSLDSGEVLRSLEIQASNEGRAPSSEWLGPHRLFVWSYEPAGPLLLDLSQDPPQQVRVFQDWFGFDMTYPEFLSSTGVFYAPDSDTYHIVVHTELPEDRSIYLYHSENGKIEQLEGNRQVMMILPSDQRMPLAPFYPIENDDYDVLWVDMPERPQVHLQVNGHLPRDYYMLQSRLLPGGTRMLFGSSQGISLQDLLSGETLAFWQLPGAEKTFFPRLSLSPDGRVLITVATTSDSQPEGSLLYRLVLEE